MALKVPIRIRGDESISGLEAERIFDVTDWLMLHARLDRVIRLVMARALEGHAVTVTEWVVLAAIAKDTSGTYTASNVAENFDMNLSQATVLVNKLAGQSLVKSKVSLKDRRVKFLSCSRSGRKLVFDTDTAMQRIMRYWLFDLKDTEIKDHIAIMGKLLSFEIPTAFN